MIDNRCVSDFFSNLFVPLPNGDPNLRPAPPPKLSTRTLGRTIQDSLIYGYTRADLETLLPEELGLDWSHDDPPSNAETKRELISGYISRWGLPQMAALARQIVTELDVPDGLHSQLQQLLEAYDAGGGVTGSTKNLIFAANGPKPKIVLRDAMNNDIEIVENAQYCLVNEDPVPAEGLKYSRLVAWWREREQLGDDLTDVEVGRALYTRLRASLDSPAEAVVFDSYARRYQDSFDIPALIPQVYLHYDPYDQHHRRTAAASPPLVRQRMDFLLLFSDRRRVVIEVDGKHHYANGDRASPELYAQMVAEDRRLRLKGYEVYRFGGAELFSDTSKTMVDEFFDQLAARMA